MVKLMKNKIFKFSNPANAVSFAARCVKPMGILMGDNEQLWVVTLSDFAIGLKVGYEALSLNDRY